MLNFMDDVAGGRISSLLRWLQFFRNVLLWLNAARPKSLLPLQIVLIIAASAVGAATLNFEYDQAGNMISGQGRYYEYNDANQLVKVRKDAPSGPVIAEYVYDYQGQRVKKTENGITTYYIGKHYEERKGNTVNEKTSYVFVNGQRVAASVKKNNETAKVSYYLNNHLGSADVVVDEQGNATDKVRYYPYGEYRTQPNEQRHTYTGKERDEATEQYYYEARYYNPFIRRFAQADTVTPNLYDPQSLNRYAYVRNNPLVYTDPSGHLFWDVIDVISFVQSAYSFAKEPSLANAGWLIADTVGLLPGLPGASTVKIGVKGVGAIADTVKLTDKANDIVKTSDKFIDTVTTVDNIDDVAVLKNNTTYQTYTKTNPKTGEVYSGRTSGTGTPEQNIAKRDKNHHMNKEGFGPAILDQSSANKDAIRGREQLLIDINGGAKSTGGFSGNKINGISSKNANRDYYIQQAKEEFHR